VIARDIVGLLIGHGIHAASESEETPRITSVFRLGESSHAPRYSLRDRSGTRTARTRNACSLGLPGDCRLGW
jgi:hypothetical protein